MIPVYVDQKVHDCIDSFYEYAKQRYMTLDEVTISRKIQRIYNQLSRLSEYANCYGNARLKTDWIEK